MEMSTVLNAKKRGTGRRSTLTQLRKEGQLAAVIYGYNTESTPISLDYKETAKTVQRNGYTTVYTIDVEGKRYNAVLTDIQRDPLKGHVKHVDFLAVNMAEELEVEVPITLTGTAIGVKEGGVLTQPNHTIKISVKPANIPDTIEVDVSELTVGDTLALADVRGKINFTVLNEDDLTLATITPPTEVGQVDDENVDKIADDVKATGDKLDSDRPGRED